MYLVNVTQTSCQDVLKKGLVFNLKPNSQKVSRFRNATYAVCQQQFYGSVTLPYFTLNLPCPEILFHAAYNSSNILPQISKKECRVVITFDTTKQKLLSNYAVSQSFPFPLGPKQSLCTFTRQCQSCASWTALLSAPFILHPYDHHQQRPRCNLLTAPTHLQTVSIFQSSRRLAALILEKTTNTRHQRKVTLDANFLLHCLKNQRYVSILHVSSLVSKEHFIFFCLQILFTSYSFGAHQTKCFSLACLRQFHGNKLISAF